jgi:hypothetical protein
MTSVLLAVNITSFYVVTSVPLAVNVMSLWNSGLYVMNCDSKLSRLCMGLWL